MSSSKEESVIERANKSWNNMSIRQKQMILYFIKRLNKPGKINAAYVYPIDECCAACGLKMDDKNAYIESIKSDIKKLTDPFWVVYGKDEADLIAWLSKADIDTKKKALTISFHEKILPFLYDLKDR